MSFEEVKNSITEEEMKKEKTLISLRKYLIGPILAIGWTLIILLFTPVLGRPIIVGYILIFIFVSFFRELKPVLLTGLFTLLSYIYLFFNYPKGILQPVLDITLFLSSLVMISLIAQNLSRIQEKEEALKAILEIKVQDRTKELRELAEQREEIIKERTKKLQEKINDLERFQRLAVGRELKMIELKKEIKKLKEELEKRKPV